MENGKQYVHMNHFTLGEKSAACEKTNTPPSSMIFPSILFLLCHFIFPFSNCKYNKWVKGVVRFVLLPVAFETPFFFHFPKDKNGTNHE